MEIRRGYNPKTSGPAKPEVDKNPAGGQYLISPITGEKVPAHKMQEHMKYSKNYVV